MSQRSGYLAGAFLCLALLSGDSNHPEEVQGPDLRTNKTNLQEAPYFSISLPNLKNNYNAYGSHIKCIWCYLYLGVIKAHSPCGRQGPRYWWSGHLLITAQMLADSTVLGAGWSQIYPRLLTHSRGLSPHQLVWAASQTADDTRSCF